MTDDDDSYERRQRRRTDSAPVPVRLRRQLLSIADSPLRQWNEEVLSLANMLVDNQDDEQLRSTFISLVMQMLVEQPLKTPFVAAVVLVANALKSEIMGAVLERLAQELQSAIAKGQWREVKLYLRFLACLQGNLEGDGVFPLLDELFNRAADLQTASSEDASFHRLLLCHSDC
jgi:nuclear cap-binding protein subunit 1